MRLAELDPRWVELNNWASPDPFYIGMSFLCPHCRTQRMFVIFVNPIDPTGFLERGVFTWPANATEGIYAPDRLCRREGDTFETMTITPPIGYLELAGHGGIVIASGEVTQCD